MTTQVDRLETLLARVQENRQRPRAASPDALAARQVAGAPTAPVATVAQRAPQVAQAPQAAQHVPQAPQAAPSRAAADARAPAKPAAAPSAAQAAPRPQATPMELALEGQGRSGSAAAQPPMPLQPSALQPAPLQPAPAAPVSYDGRVLVDAQPPQAGRPIAQVVSMHPPSQALTFGELLRRSLSLRPR